VANADQLIELFNEAKAKPAGAERERFLAEACGQDPHVKEQIVSLLQAELKDGDSDFLKRRPLIRSADLVTGKPGDTIGRYKLLEQIGEGGCGVVYMAEQEEPMRRRVALKVIKLGMDTKSVIARFEAERQALALMDHPNIAKVHDAGATETGRPFFVMELVRGIKITEYCDQQNLTTKQRLELFTQVCHAVQHAHQKGIIHRDLKPSNILVTLHDGVPLPKVIDFGIAKATSDQRLTDKTLFTALEQFIGTPAYMSPEQAEMSGLDIDTRSDIYSLGVLLYELLTGRTPLDPEDLLRSGMNEMRRKIREEEPLRPSTRLSTMAVADLATIAKARQADVPKLIHLVHGDLDWIVMKCLEKDRTRRYETANGLAMDIQRHLHSEAVVARPPSSLYRLQKMVQRNRLAVAAASAVVVATLATLVILVVSNARITRESKARVAALATAHASEQHAKEQLFLSLKSQAQARRYSRQPGQRVESLAAIAEAARIRVEPELRDEAIAAMALPDVRRGPKFRLWETNTRAIGFDALYQRCARIDDQGLVTIRSIPDNRELQQLSAEPGALRIVFSPDGKLLASKVAGNRQRVWRLSDDQPVLAEEPENCEAAAFSPDCSQCVVGQGNRILCFDLATGRERKRWTASGTIRALDFSPDSRKLAVGYSDSTDVMVYDVTDGRQTARLDVGRNSYELVRWHPDGRRLALVGNYDPRIQIWDVEARRRVAILDGHVQRVDALSFHPSGDLLASTSWDGTVRLWDPASGRQAMHIPLWAAVSFSKDGRWLGFGRTSDSAQLWESVLSEEYRTIGNSSAVRIGLYSCAISPDGQLLAVGMDDGARLWQLSTGREIAFVPSSDSKSVLFELNGEALLICSSLEGLKRWPIRAGRNPSELQIGPPEDIPLPFRPQRLSLSRDGQTLGIVSDSGIAAILDVRTKTLRVQNLPHPDACYVVLSPDGRWLATSGWHSDKVRLWKTETGERVREWIMEPAIRVSFAPDSSQLIIARASEVRFVDLHSLEVKARLSRDPGLYPGDVAFSPDEKLMAMEMTPGVVHIKEVSTCRTLAKLEDPYGDRSTALAFSPDGAQLVVLATYAAVIHTWDLRAIGVRLKQLGLDWELPAYPQSIQPNSRPLRVEVLVPEKSQGLTFPSRDPNSNPVIRNEEVAQASIQLCLADADRKQWQAATQHFELAISLCQNQNAASRKAFGEACLQLARRAEQAGQHMIAERAARQAEALFRQLAQEGRNDSGARPHPDNSLRLAAALVEMSYPLREQGKVLEAETVAWEALAIRQKALGNEHADVAQSLHLLAWNLHLQGKHTAAEALSREEAGIWRKLFGNEHPNVAWALGDLTVFLRDQRKLAEAETTIRESLGIRQKQLGGTHPDTVNSLHLLGELLHAQGKEAEVKTLLEGQPPAPPK
jgi:serine/threonine protein kinase/WD40 repeat protein